MSSKSLKVKWRLRKDKLKASIKCEKSVYKLIIWCHFIIEFNVLCNFETDPGVFLQNNATPSFLRTYWLNKALHDSAWDAFVCIRVSHFYLAKLTYHLYIRAAKNYLNKGNYNLKSGMQLNFLLLMQNLVKDTRMETSQSHTKAFKVFRGAYST